MARATVVVAAVATALWATMATTTPAAAAVHATGQINGTTLEITGSNGKDHITLRLHVGDPTTLDVIDDDQPTAVLNFDRSLFDTISVSMLGGNDRVTLDASNGAFTDTQDTTVDGGDGNDVIVGSNGPEHLLGGDGDDDVDGNQGNDTVFLGPGDDVFVWNPGDGSDTVDGGEDYDQVVFSGANVGEHFSLGPNGGGVNLTRDVGNVSMDLDGVEELNLRTLGGSDVVEVVDVVGTDLEHFNVDLAGPLGGDDGSPDTVNVFGTNSADTIAVGGIPGRADVTGLGPVVHVAEGQSTDLLHVLAGEGDDDIRGAPVAGTAIEVLLDGEADSDTVTVDGTSAADTLSVAPVGGYVGITDAATGTVYAVAETVRVNGLGGKDVITAGNGLSALTSLVLDGGAGRDMISGGDGADLLIGGTGSDVVEGRQGNDTVFLGKGNDTFVWSPGGGSDLVEGEKGNDLLRFDGAAVSEHIAVYANGARLGLSRDVASVTMDVAGVENVRLNTRPGADTVTVDDLTGTDVKNLTIDLAGLPGTGIDDGSPDDVVVNATDGDDRIVVSSPKIGVRVTGLRPRTTILASSVSDRLDVNTLPGNDVVRNRLKSNAIQLFVDGVPQ